MRGRQQPADEPYDSPFAMTILPGKAARKTATKSAGKSRKPDAVEEFTPGAATPAPSASAAPTQVSPQPAAQQLVPASAQSPGAPATQPAAYLPGFPAAPGFPPQPHYVGGELGGDYLPGTEGGHQPGHGQPGSPPAGYTPLNFLDDPDAVPDRKSTKSRAPLLVAAALVVVLAAGGYVVVPKLLGHTAKVTPTTVALPGSIGQLAKQAGPKVDSETALVVTGLHKVDPALANIQLGAYGPGGTITVAAGLLPPQVNAATPALQSELIRRINAALPNADGASDKLVAVPQPAGSGQLSCAFRAATSAAPATTDCIFVDSKAVVMIIVQGKNAQANINRAVVVRGLVEKH